MISSTFSFQNILQRVIDGKPVTPEELADLVEYMGSQSTEAQRGAIIAALGIWYLRRFK